MKFNNPRVLSRTATAIYAVGLALAVLVVAVPAQSQSSTTLDRSSALAKIDEMIGDVERIMGLKALAPIPRDLLTREEINSLVSSRLKEEDAAESIHDEELFLQLFGFVEKRFDLAEGVIDTLTEQATALYDYKTKTLYLSTWTPEDMQEYALVHELAHALADQHFDLGKYIDKSKSADGDLARSAVIEGQASWVMTEWVMRQSGRSLRDNSQLAAAAAGASRYEVTEYPVFSSQPLYLREAMLFPYTQGMIFQQAVIDRYGDDGFSHVFRHPPASTRQVIDANTYFAALQDPSPRLPRFKMRGFKRSSRGDVGQFDHRVLLQQHLSERDADRLAPRWRAGRYDIWKNATGSEAVLRYASDWANAQAAESYFTAYQQVLESKWEKMDVTHRSDIRVEGVGDNGRFIITLNRARVTSLEGLPDNTMASHTDSSNKQGPAE